MQSLSLLGVGLIAGVFAGMFGIGGGLITVPALIFLLGFKELQATGTSLAALIAAGLFFGTLLGAKIVIRLPPENAHRG